MTGFLLPANWTESNTEKRILGYQVFKSTKK